MRADSNTTEEIRITIEKFFSAYNQRDIEEALSCWLPDQAVHFFGVGEGDERLGIKAMEQNLAWVFENVEQLYYQPLWMEAWSQENTAWVAGEWLFSGKKDEKELEHKGRGTAVLVKQEGKWLLAQAHFSIGMKNLED